MSRGARGVLLVLLSCLVPAAPASASVVSVTTSTETRDGTITYPGYEVTVGTVTYRAADGERNEVVIALEKRDLRISDRAGLRAGDGCAQLSPTDALCDVRYELKALTVALGDLDDRAEVPSGAVDGGLGDDVLVGGSSVSGGPGADVLTTDGRLDGGLGPDVLRSATAGDAFSYATVSYGDRTAPVTVTPGTGADDGEAGEGDDVGPGIRGVVGGAGDDRLVLGDGPGGRLEGGAGDDLLVSGNGDDGLSGQAGDDTIRGGAGDDGLVGGAGRDIVSGEGGDDRISAVAQDERAPVGSASPDTLLGGQGNDMLSGGPGADTIVGGAGQDSIEGDGGGDVIRARDGHADLVGCVGGRRPVPSGAARLDAGDLVRGCAKIDRDGHAHARVLLVGLHLLDANIGVAVGCPQDVRPSCRVRLRLGTRAVSVAETRTTIRSGQARQTALIIDQRRLRRVRKDAPPKGQPAFCATQTLRLTVTTSDARGRQVRTSHPVRYGPPRIACELGFLDDYLTGWDPA